jgi:hypothetical protein
MRIGRVFRFAHYLAIGLLVPFFGGENAWAGGTVTSCTDASLRAALAGGGSVTFACDGTITLASTISNSVDTVLDASGHQITISGGDAVRIFFVASNSTLALTHLTRSSGRSPDGTN